MEMKKYKLKEICEIIPGYAFKSSDFGNGFNMAIKITDINPPCINLSNINNVLSTPKDPRTRVVKGDFVMAMTGATIGKIGRLLQDVGNVYINQRVCKFEPKENVDKDFLFYLLSLDQFKKFIFANIDSSSAQPNIGHPTLYNYELSLPELSVQQKIAAVLSSLDDKIALNRRINAKLEAMAKRLYDYWFVQFDFPDENGKPYKSSGGKMVWNEELKMEIPEGWKVKSLGDVLDNSIYSTTAGDHLKNLDYCPIDEIPMRTMSFANGKSYKEANSSLQLYARKDILIGAMRVYFHRCCIASKPGITRTTTIVLKPKEKTYLNYLYQVCNEEKTFNFAMKVSNGTQQPYVTWNALSEYQFAYPNNTNLIKVFCNKINASIDKNLVNVQEIEKLTALRDFLLPMLMNGQVKVEDNLQQNEVVIPFKDNYERKFELWLENQGLAARGTVSRKTLRAIFDAMDDDDK